MILRFGEASRTDTADAFELDEELYELRRGGRVLALEPKTFDLLCHLIHSRERVVSKGELLERVWPDEHVTESVLHRGVSLLRKALGDGEARALIATVRGRGYRFTGAVREAPREEAAAAEPPFVEAAAPGGEPFLGRDAVMAELRRAREEAAAGRGRVALLVGEPGIGKTRILEALLEELPTGAPAFVGRCLEEGGAPPYWPWIQVLRGLEARSDAARGLRERLEGAEEGGAAAREDDAPGGERRARFGLFDEVGRALEQAARREGPHALPLVLALEDLHWADPASLLLLQQLAPLVADMRLLLVATLRDERRARGDPFSRMRGDLSRLPHVRRVALEGLDREQVARFLEDSLGRPPPEPLLDAVHERTEGNPLFLREVVRWLRAQPQADFPEFVPSWQVALPDGIRDVIERRIDALGEPVARVLEVAAIVGRSFDAGLVAAVHGADGEGVSEALETARAARVIERAPDGPRRFAFSHALVRETLLDALPDGVRVQLHARVGQALEAAFPGDRAPMLRELAHHFFEAFPLGGEGRALDYAERAAEAATARLAWEEAAAHLERAVSLIDRTARPDPARRLALFRRLGEAWRAVGDVEAMRAAFLRAAEAARAQGLGDTHAELALAGMAAIHWGPVEPTLGEQVLTSALEALPDRPSRLRVRLLARAAGHSFHVAAPRLALARSTRAVEEARHLEDPPALLAALLGHVLSLHHRMLEPDGLAAYDVALEEAWSLATRPAVERELLDLEGESRLHVGEWRAARALLAGDGDGFRREIAGVRRLCARSRHPMATWNELYLQSALALLAGRLDEAEGRLLEGFRLGQRYNLPWAGLSFLGGAFELARCRGRMLSVADSISLFRRNMPAGGGLLMRALELALPAEVGRAESVRREFASWVDGELDALPRNHEWLLVMGALADVAVALGDRERGARIEHLLAPYAGLHRVIWGIHIYQGPVSRNLGHLAALLGRDADAVAHYEAALASVEALGARPDVVRIRLDLASHLRERGREAGRATALAEEALDEATRLGLGSSRARAEALLGRARSES